MRPAVLVVLDGWALADPGPGNAVALADTPVFDSLWQRWPHTTLTTHGPAVGLPDGQMGNSEVGHLNLGAGAIVKQDLLRIDEAIEDGSFLENETLRAACRAERVHLLGLVSGGGVHASMGHLRALIELADRLGVGDVVVHAFTDGRDTAPDSGAGYLAEVESWPGRARVASVTGRYYAMDRDRRWDRTELTLRALVDGEAEFSADSAQAAVRQAYERGETDEFIKPTLVDGDGRIRAGESVIVFNFRPDRARQLTQKLDERLDVPITTLTEYNEDWDYPVAFPPARPGVTIASVLSERGVSQLHVAETEKYAHVTYFFNGGEEDPYKGEERCLVDSPRDVPTYDHKPQMSAAAATDAFVERWPGGGYGFGIINFANPDMVGHTGVIEAAVKAIECVDGCLRRVVDAVEGTGGVCVVTADHGNADQMLEPDGSPNTAHSKNPVPLVVTADVGSLRDGGILADVAPTLLDLMEVEKPREMTGTSLLQASRLRS
ncbi:MAG TPA: 2,3-bisphosphoglycerate-independent phosphoglycerate mutase [Thermoleophilaceae bacterium]|nr:2,3-bisphosphoglycerate-independent phosphoglycerate mutase [Thermoleophilaceae bacterium]